VNKIGKYGNNINKITNWGFEMKKILVLVVLFIFSTVFYFNFTNSENIEEKIADKIIRFHIIGNMTALRIKE